MEERYNGWVNRETWAVHLYITNDEGFYNYVMDTYLAIKNARTIEYKEEPRLSAVPLNDAIRHDFEDWLNNHFEELTETPYAELKRDTLTMLFDIGSVWRVDWREVASALVAKDIG